jgi:periplasmic protein TonB
MSALSLAQGLPMRSQVHTSRWRVAAAPPPPPVPLKALALSALGHIVVVAVIVAVTLSGMLDRTTVHVVNLFPSIAAVGTPAGTPAALPTRTPLPARPPVPEPEPRVREAAKPAEAALPSRAVAPRAGDRELPPLGTPSDRRGKTAVEPAARQAASALGQSTGSITGQGTMTLDVTDFPHAWYLRQVLQKVEERWQTQNRPNEPGQKPRIYVEIQRDGSIATPRIEQSSGSTYYDRAALRAISEASPFPPLPSDWSKPALRVLFNFDLKRG